MQLDGLRGPGGSLVTAGYILRLAVMMSTAMTENKIENKNFSQS